ncbi:MAG TPA: FGGY-family carbohydrate kinase [Caulobacteraceae bacterium]|jgi:glycerol kinase
MPELLLGLDVGTTSLGAGLFSPDGRLLAWSARRLRTLSPAPGRLQQDPAAIWRAARAVIRGALAGAGRGADDLAAIGVTSQRTSAMLWERRSGRPRSPLVLWSDLSGAARAAELRAAGHFVAPQQAAAKLEALAAGAAGRDLAWGNIDSYLIYRLSGGAAHVTDRSQAWPTGYLDLSTMGWNGALIAHQGLDSALFPALADTWGALAQTAPRLFGRPIPITADVADQQAALIAHGGAAGTVKATFGTSATLDLATGAELVLRDFSTPPFVLSSVAGDTRFCVEGMVYSAGAALDWAREAMRLGSPTAFDRLAAQVGDAAGVAFLPALQGLGAPHGDAARRGALVGLHLGAGRAHLARAAMEGVAFRTREVFEHLCAVGGAAPPDALGVDGGLAGSDVFLQLQADLLGRPLRRHAIREATACGAAIAAGRGAGLLTEADAAAFVRYERTFEPRLGPAEADARFAAWKAAVYG